MQAIIASRPERLTFVAFDILHLDGLDLRPLPLAERRRRLQKLIGAGGTRIHFSQDLPGTGAEVFAAIERAGLEGLVAKRTDSPYRSGRVKNWLKVKAFDEDEFDLIAVRREKGKPPIALMARAGKPVGSAFITLPAGAREQLWQHIQDNPVPPPATSTKKDTVGNTHWLRPGIKGMVKFLKGEGSLRHATLRDWREDPG